MTPNRPRPRSEETVLGSGPSRYPGSTPHGKQSKQVERTLDLLFRRRWIIISCLLIAGLIAGIYAFSQTPVYQTSAVVLLDLNRMPGGMTEEVIGSTPFVRAERSLATEIFVLQNSYSIAQGVHERIQQMAAEGADIQFPPRGSVRFESASRAMNSAISVQATSHTPQEASLLANAYAEEYLQQTKDASRQYLAAARVFLEQQEARRSAELEEAEEALQLYHQARGPASLSREAGTLVARMVGMETARDEALIEFQVREAQTASIEEQLQQINPQLAARMASDLDRRLALLRGELDRLESERRDIQNFASRRGQAADERLDEIERRITSVEDEMRDLTDQYLQEVMAVGGMDASASAVAHAADLKRRSIQERIELQGLGARLETMNQRLEQYRSDVSSIPELTTDLARLERDRQLAEQMYRYVVQRLQDIRIQEESEPGYARILRHAGVPGEPVGTGPWRGLGMGLMLGLLLGLVLATVRDRLDTRIYQIDQVRESGRPFLGLVPDLKTHIREEHGGAVRVERDGVEVSSSLVTLLAPLSAASEAFRHVRTTLQFSRLDRVVQTVLVTSAAQGDGKTTAAANLAITMAQSHRRTILIDADLRRSRVHELFGVSNAWGLAQLLDADEIADSEALKYRLRFFQSPQHPNLFVLPSGPFAISDGIDNPAELLGSKRMRDLLQALNQQFDAVIIDTPPVLAATDGVLLSTQVDAVVVVVRAGATKGGDLDHTVEMLDDVGAPIAGLMLNGFDISMAYGYRYTYGHYSKVGPYSRYEYARPAVKSAKS